MVLTPGMIAANRMLFDVLTPPPRVSGEFLARGRLDEPSI